MQASPERYENEKSGVTARRDVTGPARPPQIGEVVRDAMDHAHVIARDAVTLGRLEAEHVIALAKDEARTAIGHAKIEASLMATKAKAEAEDIAVRVAVGAVATSVGTVGVVFLGIAIFLGLGTVIPSLAARFGLFAAVFLATATFAAMRVGKARKVTVREHDDRLRHLVPTHHLDDEV
jgi:hypothetical protein